MARYRVLEHHLDRWYGNADDETIAWIQEEGFPMEGIERLAEAWGKSVESLMEQVEEIEEDDYADYEEE